MFKWVRLILRFYFLLVGLVSLIAFVIFTPTNEYPQVIQGNFALLIPLLGLSSIVETFWDIIEWIKAWFGFIDTSASLDIPKGEEIKEESNIKYYILTIILLLIFGFIIYSFFPPGGDGSSGNSSIESDVATTSRPKKGKEKAVTFLEDIKATARKSVEKVAPSLHVTPPSPEGGTTPIICSKNVIPETTPSFSPFFEEDLTSSTETIKQVPKVNTNVRPIAKMDTPIDNWGDAPSKSTSGYINPSPVTNTTASSTTPSPVKRSPLDMLWGNRALGVDTVTTTTTSEPVITNLSVGNFPSASEDNWGTTSSDKASIISDTASTTSSKKSSGTSWITPQGRLRLFKKSKK